MITETVQTVILVLGSLTVTLLAIDRLPEVGIHSYEALEKAVTAARYRMITERSTNEIEFIAGLFCGRPVLYTLANPPRSCAE